MALLSREITLTHIVAQSITQLAFTFDFPFALFFSVLAMSTIVAIVGSYLPARVLRRKEIELALKNM